MSKKYKILQVCYRALPADFDYSCALNNAFPPDQFEQTTIFLRGTLPPEQVKAYYGKVIFWQLRQTYFKPKIYCLLRLLKLCWHQKFDMAICHQYKPSVIVNMLQRFIKISNIFYVLHGTVHESKKVQKLLGKQKVKYAKVITASDAARQDLLRSIPTLDPDKCLVVKEKSTEDYRRLVALGSKKSNYKIKSGDHVYQFDPAVTKSFPIQIKNNTFQLPDAEFANTAVLLKLKVKNKKPRKFGLPYLQINTSRQYLEPNKDGIKYLNITDVIANVQPGQSIELSSKHLLYNPTAELMVFTNEPTKAAKVLTIAPHPDDAELGAYGFYSSHDSTVITLTAGENGRLDYCQEYSAAKLEQRLFRAKTRILDSITVPIRAGIKPDNVINLGYFNDTLLNMYNEPDKSVASVGTNIEDVREFRKFNISNLTPKSNGQATWNNLVADLVELINKQKPEIILLPHPLLDKHQDHRFSSLAVFEAVQKCGLKQGRFFFYVYHSYFSTKYPYGPRYTPVTLPPNLDEDQMQYGVYSYPLTRQQQIEKLFALDAMHDIAPIPGKAHNFSLKNNKPWIKYYRKAIRANEIFLVVPFAKLEQLIKITKLKFREYYNVG